MNAIAKRLKSTGSVVKAALAFAKGGGKTPLLLPRKAPKQGKPISKEIEAEIVRLRDEESLSFPKIAQKLDIGNSSASVAYRRGKRTGDPVPHKPSRKLTQEAWDTIDAMLGAGKTEAEIARAVGCSGATVSRRKLARPKG